MARLRVVSYNVAGLRHDAGAVVELLRRLAPDVVMLQEAPRRWRWRSRAAALAAACGLVVAAGGAPAVGNLILTHLRVRADRAWQVRFPLTPGRHLRGVALLRGAVGGAEVIVAGAHLSTDPGERPGQARLLARTLAEAAEPTGSPVLLGVDVNDVPGSAAWQALGTRLADAGGDHAAPTFPAGRPDRRIDALFVDRRVRVQASQVPDTAAARRGSDHLPVVAHLWLPDRQGGQRGGGEE